MRSSRQVWKIFTGVYIFFLTQVNAKRTFMVCGDSHYLFLAVLSSSRSIISSLFTIESSQATGIARCADGITDDEKYQSPANPARNIMLGKTSHFCLLFMHLLEDRKLQMDFLDPPVSRYRFFLISKWLNTLEDQYIDANILLRRQCALSGRGCSLPKFLNSLQPFGQCPHKLFQN